MVRRWWLFFIALNLLVLLLTACGEKEGKSSSIVTATPTPTPTVTPSLTATPTPTAAKEPVKIGAIGPWSGPMAMSGLLADQIIALVEEQVKNIGGILGGREVKFIRGDDRGMVAESAGQAKKLVLDDKVIILTLGGVSAAHFTAVADAAEELKVPYVALSHIYGLADKKYSACLYSQEAISGPAHFIADRLEPKTVAYLAYETENAHQELDGVEDIVGARDILKAKGIDIVYEQYFPQDAVDFTPYLTRIKYLKPDVLETFLNDAGQAIAINKQIMELGGWGNMKYFGATTVGSAKAVVTMPSAVGTYVTVQWLPGSDDPGMKAFEDAFKQKYDRLPDPSLTYFYNCFWTAIKAIELAGTDDPGEVAQALRSGNLEWDSAWGHLRIPPNGKGEVNYTVVQVQEGGKLAKVWSLRQ